MFNVADGPVGDGMTAFVFAPKKPCNCPRIAVVWSAYSDQLLTLRTACTTSFVMAFTMSKSSAAVGSTWARTSVPRAVTNTGDRGC